MQRAYVLRVVALVFGVVYLDTHVFAFARGQLEGVAPEVSLGLEPDGLLAFHALGFFDIDGHRQPDAGLHVHAPAVEVEVVFRGILVGGRGKGAVEANDVGILILDPDTAIEPPHARNLGVNVENPGAHRTQELPPHVAEYVMLLVKSRGVEKHHFGETERIVGELRVQSQGLGQAGNGGERSLEEALFGLLPALIALVKKALAEVHPAEHVLVSHRDLVQLDVRPDVLDIGLHKRGVLLNVPDQDLLACDGPLHQRRLVGGELVSLFILGLLLGVEAGSTESKDQEGSGDLPKRHFNSCVVVLSLAACRIAASRGQIQPAVIWLSRTILCQLERNRNISG